MNMKHAVASAAVALALFAQPAHADWPPVLEQAPPKRYGDWELTRFVADLRLPYYVHRYIFDYRVSLLLPAIAQGAFAELPAGTRFPIGFAPDFPDLKEARWRVFSFGNFRADAFPNLGMALQEQYEGRTEPRYIAYRSLPRQTTGPAVPHRVENLPYGPLRIPVLNYSPDMVSGAPCPLGASLTSPAPPKLTLDLDGLRFPGAAIIPDDPCVTQRALDLAVYALSYASPDRPMKDFLAGLNEIARRATPIAYGRSDVGRYYRGIYLEQMGIASLSVRESGAAGGGMFFLPPGHEGKRLYWLLVHPPGDPRLRPIAYDYDEKIMAEQRRLNNNEAPQFAGYWRPRLLDNSGRNTLIPWIGRVGIPFVLYSPDEAVVCGRDPMASALVIGARDPNNPNFYLPQLMWAVRDFGHVACEFAASPRLRNGGGPMLTAVVYLFWDARQNRWVFDDVAVGSSAWTPLAGVVRDTYAMYDRLYEHMHYTPAALVMQALPSFSGY